MNRFNFLFAFLLFTAHVVVAQHESAKVQILHASADPTLPAMDLWVNGERTIENFKLGDATPFIEIPVDSTIAIDCYRAGTGPGTNPFVQTTARQKGGSHGTIVLTGLVNEHDFMRNPDAWYTFFIYRSIHAMLKATSPNVIDLKFFNAATDSPGLDIYDEHNSTLYTDLQYCWQKDNKDYVSVMPTQKTLTIRNNRNPDEVIGTYSLNLVGREGQAAIVLLSGFLAPDKNQDGPALALTAYFADGTVQRLSSVTSVHETPLPVVSQLDVYPSPVKTSASVAYQLEHTADVQIDVSDNLGRKVFSQSPGRQSEGAYLSQIQADSWKPGIYRIQVHTGEETRSKYIMVVR